jgi:thiol-disulfide isomerase/thioredoxin
MDARRDRQEIGDALAPFVLRDLDDRAQDLRSCLGDNRGAVVVFWSSVCSHCVRYDGYLNGFAEQHPQLALVAVASRQGESMPELQTAVAQRSLEFQVLHDEDREIARRWLVAQTPRVFLLDRELRIVYRGAIDNFKYPEDPEHSGYLESAIDDFLAGRSVARPETASFGCPVQSVYYTMPKPLRTAEDDLAR